MRYECIRERAEIVHELIDEKVNQGSHIDNGDFLDAYKATFALKNRSVSIYRRSFTSTGLDFDIKSVEAVYESFSFELPDPSELTYEEKEILKELLITIHEGPHRAFF